MTNIATSDNSTRRPGRPARGRKFPASLAVMLSAEQRAALDDLVDAKDISLGAVARELLAHGLDLSSAYASDPMLEHDVARLAKGSGATNAEAIARMLRFAVREADQRV